MRLMDALNQRRWDILSQAILDTIGIDVDPDKLKEACISTRYQLGDGSPLSMHARADDTVMMWLRNRLDELGAVRCGKQSNREILTCELHVGFVSVVETDEHIYNLKKKWESMLKYWESRSKITDCQLALRAIDRVAARVGPKERG